MIRDNVPTTTINVGVEANEITATTLKTKSNYKNQLRERTKFIIVGVAIVALVCSVVSLQFVIYRRFVHEQQSASPSLSSLVTEQSCTPRGIHLAPLLTSNYEHSNASVTVSFFVKQTDCIQKNYIKPIVYYGQVQHDDIQMVYGPTQYLQAENNSSNVTSKMTFQINSIVIFHIPLINLEPGEKEYWYYILFHSESESQTPSSMFMGSKNNYHFRTPPFPSAPTKIAVVGDIGRTINSQRTLESIYTSSQQEQLSHAIMLGDISYAGGVFSRWIKWFDFANQLLFLPSILTTTLAGNHEIECDQQTGQLFIPYEHWFQNPNRIADAVTPEVDPIEDCTSNYHIVANYLYGNSFYAYQYGMVHVIVLNSYVDCTDGSEQYKWLDKELSTGVNRTVTPWLLVALHAPFYTTFTGHPRANIESVVAMEELFYKYQVNVVFAGHDHAYMRTYPMFQYKRQHKDTDSTTAPIHITVGTGGCAEGPPLMGYKHKLFPEDWVAVRHLRDSGFGQIEFVNATHAYWEFRANDITVDIKKVDSFIDWLLKTYFQGRDWGGSSNEDDTPFRDGVWLSNGFFHKEQ